MSINGDSWSHGKYSFNLCTQQRAATMGRLWANSDVDQYPASSRDRDGNNRDRDRDNHHDRDGHRDRDSYRDRERERERDYRPRDKDYSSSRRDDYRRRDRDTRDTRDRERERERDRHSSSRRRPRSRSPYRSSHRSSRKRSRFANVDLTNVVSIDKRQRAHSLWDIKPPGYENVTAEMAKLSGVFPLPGTGRPADPSKLQGLVANSINHGNNFNGPNGNIGSRSAGQGTGIVLNIPANALRLENSRSARRLLVGGFDGSISEAEIKAYFNSLIASLELEDPVETGSSAVLQSFTTSDGAYVVLEFLTAEMATVGYGFDQAFFQDDDSKFVMTIRRPVDYITPFVDPLLQSTEPVDDDTVRQKIPDSSHKICIAGIPHYLNQAQIQEVLVAFGPITGFCLVRDKGDAKDSRGIAFCEFKDHSTTPIACQGLNGMELGDSKLRVKLACKGLDVDPSLLPFSSLEGMSSLGNTVKQNNKAGIPYRTPVLQLLNMVTPEELVDNTEYAEIVEDIGRECSKFGPITKIVVPRPDPKSVGTKRLMIQVVARKPEEESAKVVRGVGKVYIKFESAESCERAFNALSGRKFSDRTVISSFYPEENFDLGIF